ncbi:MAG: sulfur transferase domain-containing protein [Planctomycetota bacterium]
MILRSLTLLISVLFLSGCSSRTDPAGHPAEAGGLELARPVPELAGEFRSVYRSGNVYFAGLPTEKGMRDLARGGVKLVVNALTDPEQSSRVPFDEPALLDSLAVDYIHIPVSPETFSRKDVDLFAEKMATAQGEVLLHCASSNRAGGLWASYLYLHKGMSLEDAMAQGKAAGLGAPSMVAAVERVMGS